MKVLIAHNWYFEGGGADRVFFDTKRILEKNGHIVIPFSMKDERNYDSEFKDYFVDKIDYSDIKPNFKNLKTALKMIYSIEAKNKIELLIRKTKPDIAHLHNIYGRLTPSILYALRKYNIPIVMTLHDYKLLCPSYHMSFNGKTCEDCKGGKFYRAVIKRCHKNSYLASAVYTVESYIYSVLKTYEKCVDIFIAPSQFIRNKFIEFGFPEDKIEFVPNFVDIKFNIQFNRSKDYFLYSGKLLKVKGIFTLLKAVKGIDKAMLYIAGDGELREEVKNYIKENKLDNVKLLDQLSRDELFKILADALFVVLPSECYENAPLAVLEAFALGKPVIGAKIGGIPEMVIDGETGFLFNPGDHNDLREKIIFFLNNPHKVSDLGKKARKKLEMEYNAEVHYQKLMEIYQRILYLHKNSY
jgi:glycosyltransferase involved in cell wall biosynthesis